MRFADIKPFIQAGSYEINIGLSFLERELADYEKDYGLELNPDFQRGHVWTEAQQIAYMEFLLRGGKTARVIYLNSPVFGDRREKGDLSDTLLCVDGLQRLTACLHFVRNEIPVFGTYYKDYEDRPSITDGLLFNINGLKKRSEVLQWYIEFNSGGTIHTEDEINRVKRLLADEQVKQHK
ncbi:DUF262 domain-containing protein [Bacillus sp. JJ722]|uniref:DUF262 domain-containing protein n=1 Tax=Bacillus sp. JJ722 TaxID=3122973 RepID=UPI002FFDB963